MVNYLRDRAKALTQRDAGCAEEGVSTIGIVVAIVLIIIAIALGIAAHPLFFALIVVAIVLLFVL